MGGTISDARSEYHAQRFRGFAGDRHLMLDVWYGSGQEDTLAYLRLSEAKAAGSAVRSRLQKSAPQILREEARGFSKEVSYDVFLSHSYDDAEVILGIKNIMESFGLRVYVDWIEDPALDRTKVRAKTAGILRERMRSAASLVYVHSANASDSVWMPWELGYFDGFKPTYVWILPLVVTSDSEFKGQEYLGLYPTVDKIASIAGRLELGFTNVGQQKQDLPLAKAAK